jgi:nicotinate (nicotinamide) nucleotide adenylyltransferase
MADGLPDSKKRRIDQLESSGSDEDKMQVVLALCGSFNPVTFLHLRLFELAKNHLEKVCGDVIRGGLISPVHIAYGKKGLLSNEHRLTMARLAVQGSDWISVDDWECSQDKWIETAKVLPELEKRAKSKYPSNNIKLKFLCGADLLESFATPNLWAPEDIRAIVCNFGLVVVSRFGSNPDKFIYESDTLHELKSNIEIVTEWIPNDVSSTKIRRSLGRGESVRYLVPDPVIDYITNHSLYQVINSLIINRLKLI